VSKRQKGKLETKLDLLIRLTAINLVSGKKQRDQIRLLALAEMSPIEIASVLGTTANTVNVALSSIRKTKELNLRRKDDKDGD
jgi:DNA-directed RNA polymerase specialized sigma24 family protein